MGYTNVKALLTTRDYYALVGFYYVWIHTPVTYLNLFGFLEPVTHMISHALLVPASVLLKQEIEARLKHKRN